MTTYSKYNIVYRLQKWMDSVAGQTFLNYAYSWGAAVVILGTLLKLTHNRFADIALYLGMGTEVLVFFLSAFDRPFDKTADGMPLDIHPGADRAQAAAAASMETEAAPVVIVSGGAGAGIAAGHGNVAAAVAPAAGLAPGGAAAVPGGAAPVFTVAGSSGSAPAVPPLAMPGVEEATARYADELNRLTEMLSRVSAQSERLTVDSEEMENLNRTLTGICKVYEMQLKSASSQMGTIDEIQEQTRRMAAQIAELNRIYARMIEAMTAKMNV